MKELSPDLMKYMDDLMERYPKLETARQSIIDSYLVLEKCFAEGGKLLIAGNGGSAADAEHIVGELMKGFCKQRKISKELEEKLKQIDAVKGEDLSAKLQEALPAIALDNHSALNTAFLNDVDGLMCFAQQVMGYGMEGDVFLGISTSGNSLNVIYAAIAAKAKGLKIIGLTGKSGRNLEEVSDISIKVNEVETYRIQELHLPVYHCLCLMLEQRFY